LVSGGGEIEQGAAVSIVRIAQAVLSILTPYSKIRIVV
jgi:hypothetical protein